MQVIRKVAKLVNSQKELGLCR